MTPINKRDTARKTTKRDDKRAPYPTEQRNTNTLQTHSHGLVGEIWQALGKEGGGEGKPYCSNLILWSLIVSCCSSLPDRVCWAYVKHISPLSVGALPASFKAAQRQKPQELLKADRQDNLPIGLQLRVQSSRDTPAHWEHLLTRMLRMLAFSNRT